MAKKGSARRPRKNAQKPRRRAVRSAGPAPGGVGRRSATPAVQALAEHRAAFLAWAEAEQPHGAETDGAELWSAARELLEEAAAPAGLSDPTRCTADEVAELADVLEEDGWEPHEAAPGLDALVHVLEFLGATGRWRGSEDELDACLGVLADAGSYSGSALAPSPVAAIASLLGAVEVDPADERRALAALPLVERVEALLAWVRPGRAVTERGGPVPEDLAEAAALVGAPVPGSVASLADVAALDRAWHACRDAGLVVVGPARARLGELGAAWSAGSAEEQHEARQALVLAYLQRVLWDEQDDEQTTARRSTAVAGALVALVVAGPVVPPDLLEADPEAGALASAELEHLAEVGIARRDGDEVGVTPGLEELVAAALADFIADDEE